MRAGTLVVDIAANVARLQQDMAQAKGVVAGAMNEISRSVNIAKSALAGLGVGLSVGALGAMAANIVKTTAALDDMAEATGTTVENLSKLQTVAKIGGKDFSSIEDGLVKLTKGLKGTDEETRNASAALDYLGIKSRDAAGKLRDPGEIMREVAKRLNEFEDGAGKTALALDLFGKRGAQLLPFLKDLAEEGSVAARVTAEQAAQAEKLEKAINRLQIAGEDARRSFVLAWIDDMVDLAEKMNDAAKAGGNLATALVLVAGGRRPVSDIDKDIADIENRSTLSKWARNGLTMGYAGMADKAQLALLYRQRDYQLAQLSRNAAGLQDDLSGTWRGPDAKGRIGYTGAGKPAGGTVDDAGAALLLSLKDQLASAQGPASVYESVLRKLDEGTKKYSASTRESALELARQIDAFKQGALDAARFTKQAEAVVAMDERQGEILAQTNQMWSERAQALEAETALIGADQATREKAVAFRQIDLELQKQMVDATPETVEALEKLAEAEKARLGAIIDAKVAREESRKAAEEAQREWKSVFERRSDALTRTIYDGLMSGFERGAKSGAQVVIDTLKNALKSAVFEPVIHALVQPVSNVITGTIMSALGAGGGSGGGIGNMLSLGSTAYNAFSGNSMLGNLGGLLGGASYAGVPFFGGSAIAGSGIAAEAAALGIADAPLAGAASSLLGPAGLALGLGALVFGGGLFGDSNALPEIPLGLQHPGIDQGRLSSDAMYRQAAEMAEAAHRAQFGVSFTQPNANGDGSPAQAVSAAVERIYQQLAAEQQGYTARLNTGSAYLSSLSGYVSGMSVSEYLSPEARLSGARSLYDAALAKANAGDVGSAQALPSLAQTLLGAGRQVYASGPQFQELWTQTNNDLARVLEQQGQAQASLLAEMPAAIRESASDTIAQLKLLREDLKAGLERLNAGLRQMNAGLA